MMNFDVFLRWPDGGAHRRFPAYSLIVNCIIFMVLDGKKLYQNIRKL